MKDANRKFIHLLIDCVGGGQLGVWEAAVLHVAVGGRVDLHLEHPPPRHHLHGQIHRRHPPRHLPQHHDRQEV